MVVKEETRKGPWTEKEDLQLVCFVDLYGERRWDFIAKVSGLNRTGKSCRLRWVNYLHPGLKRGRMTPQEERLVLELHSRWGNRWSRIARKLPGRTDNEIKNYWRTHMRKKAQEIRNRSSNSSRSCSLNESRGVEDGVGNEKATRDREEESSSSVKGYPMEQIWNEIAESEMSCLTSYEECKDEACNFSCAPPMMPASPPWDDYNNNYYYYCLDSLWN